MKNHRYHLIQLALVAALLIGLAAGCTQQRSQPDDGKVSLMVSVVPQAYFVERIGGEYVTVSAMVEPGASPATYEPKPEQLKALAKADAYLSIGVPFEDVWLERIAEANDDMLMVDTIANIERMPMTEPHLHDEDEAAEEDEHAAGAPDPHVWLSPELVKIQAQAIYEALVQLDPAHQGAYAANLAAFIADIETLADTINATLEDVPNKRFMVFHPSWGYFAHDFGLEQIAVEIGGQEPSAQELAFLIDEAKEEGIRVIFAQPEFSTQDAETIAKEIGGEVLLISPLAHDWLTNLEQVAQTFARVLAE